MYDMEVIYIYKFTKTSLRMTDAMSTATGADELTLHNCAR